MKSSWIITSFGLLLPSVINATTFENAYNLGRGKKIEKRISSGNISGDICDTVRDVVNNLNVNQATSFCSSFLGINPTTTVVVETEKPITTVIETLSDFETLTDTTTSIGFATTTVNKTETSSTVSIQKVTSTALTTSTISTQVTETSTVTVFTDVTTTFSTVVIQPTNFNTISGGNTIVGTTTSISVSTFTSTFTETVLAGTVTSYTTAGRPQPKKRSEVSNQSPPKEWPKDSVGPPKDGKRKRNTRKTCKPRPKSFSSATETTKPIKSGIPPFLDNIPDPIISKACSCLNIPTPVVTNSQRTTANVQTITSDIRSLIIGTTTSTILTTETGTTTVTTTVTITGTVTEIATVAETSTLRLTGTTSTSIIVTKSSIISVKDTATSTVTIDVTTRNPVLATVSSVSVTTTSTTTTITTTQTNFAAFTSPCVNILGNQKLYNAVVLRRQTTFPFATTRVFPSDGSETTFSNCCQLCHNALDCSMYYTYQQSSNNWQCQIITNSNDIGGGRTDQCPKGIIGQQASGNTGTFVPGTSRGLGPCFGMSPPP